MKPVISSEKHYIQNAQVDIPSLTVSSIPLVTSVHVQDKDVFAEVREGSVVKAIFLEVWLQASTDADCTFVCIVEKAMGTVVPPLIAEMNLLNSYLNKKNILFTSQGLLARDTGANPTPVLRQWIKIPRGKQRMGLGDKMRVVIASIGSAPIKLCMFATYKSYN